MALYALTDDALELIKNFDRMPDDALAPPKVAAKVLNMSERTLRRCPPIPKVQTSKARGGFRVGDIRKLIRSGTTA